MLRHYEVVFLVHPDQSAQVPAMLERYRRLLEESGGKIHRLEDCGRRQFAYTINRAHKAHYILLNIECNEAVVNELKNAFRYNDAVLRNLILRCDAAITEQSPMMRQTERAHRPERGGYRDRVDDRADDRADDRVEHMIDDADENQTLAEADE